MGFECSVWLSYEQNQKSESERKIINLLMKLGFGKEAKIERC